MFDKFLAIIFSKTTIAISALVATLIGVTALAEDGYRDVGCDDNDIATCVFCGPCATDTCDDIGYNCGVTACKSADTCKDNSCNFMMGFAEGCYSEKGSDCYISFADCKCTKCLDEYCTDDDGGFAVNCEGKPEK